MYNNGQRTVGVRSGSCTRRSVHVRRYSRRLTIPSMSCSEQARPLEPTQLLHNTWVREVRYHTSCCGDRDCPFGAHSTHAFSGDEEVRPRRTSRDDRSLLELSPAWGSSSNLSKTRIVQFSPTSFEDYIPQVRCPLVLPDKLHNC